jgi:hypothetical protein
MAQSSAAGQAPIPPAKKDDTEDVAWALSTAEAMYARGDRGDALKWLRRAAESASEAQADDRALELAKAAADLATVVGPTPSAPPPPPPPPRASYGPPPATASVPPPAPAALAAPVPAAAPVVPPPPPTQRILPSASQPPPAAAVVTPVTAATAVTPARPQSVRPPAAPLPAQRIPEPAPSPKPLARPPGAVTPSPARTLETRRAARRSRPDIDFSRKVDEPTQTMQDMAVPLQPKRRGRGSRPAAEELTPLAPPVASRPPSRVPIPAGARTDESDAWPTQTSLPAHDHADDPPDEKTRIGVPAYEASARMATEVQSTPSLEDTPLRAAQALRVVVWRTPEGVRVAPHGTHVAAITVDAVLVALDPSADLAAWLSGK